MDKGSFTDWLKEVERRRIWDNPETKARIHKMLSTDNQRYLKTLLTDGSIANKSLYELHNLK